MFYQNKEIPSHLKANCEGQGYPPDPLLQEGPGQITKEQSGYSWKDHLMKSELENWCETTSFRMALISSNNPEFFMTRKGYIICENEFEYFLQPGYVSYSSKNA